jgi:Terpene synthase family 2, C-terminal metal binding
MANFCKQIDSLLPNLPIFAIILYSPSFIIGGEQRAWSLSEHSMQWAGLDQRDKRFCDIIDLFNDLHSIKKEEAIGDPHNAVFILQKQHGLTRDEATRQAAGYVHRWTHQFHAQK